MQKRNTQILILVLCSIFLAAGMFSTSAYAADKKITELTELTTPVDVDLVVIVDDPAGSPITKKLTWANIKATLKTYFDALYNNYTHPNHTGDVTSSGDGAQTITAKAVTLTKMDDMATASLLGRNTAEVGVPEVLSKATTLSLLNVADGADVTGSNAPQAHAASHQNAGGDEISVTELSGLLADDQHVLDAEVLAVAAVKGANADITSMTALTQAGNSAGILKIQADAQGDVYFFGDADVGDAEVGNKVYIYRKAAGGDNHVCLYLDQYGSAVIAANDDIKFSANGNLNFFGDGATTTFGRHWSSGQNDMFRFYGWITAAGTAKYVQYQVNDTTDNLELKRQDSNIGYFDIQIPTIFSGGNVGVGAVPGNPLAVNRSADGVIVDFESADIVEGNISITDNTTSYNAFVGSHYAQLKAGQKELPVGAIVISTGEIIPCEANIEKTEEIKTEILIEDAFENVEIEELGEKIGEDFDKYELKDEKIIEIKKPVFAKIKKMKRQLKTDYSFDAETGKIYKAKQVKKVVSKNVHKKEYFTYIDTTDKVADKRVYGVWLGKMADDAKGTSFGQDDKSIYLIAQVGLFKIRVTDTNGNIEIGDYLETSARPMESQRQVGNQKTNSTIAKALVNVDWSLISTDTQLGYKWQLIPCIF